MDAQSEWYWIGSLSMAAALALREPDLSGVRRVLKRTLDEFLASPAASTELRTMLREEMRK